MVVLDHVDSFDPTLEVAYRALSWWSGELTSANAYLAVGETNGFHLHWDDHEVIAVQLSGEKSWEVRGPNMKAARWAMVVFSPWRAPPVRLADSI